MTTLYWQLYKNLEREFCELADSIYQRQSAGGIFDEDCFRTVIEIEALAKELYLANGGTVMPDEDMYFDTVCMNHLNSLWSLDKKVVMVVSPNVFPRDLLLLTGPNQRLNSNGQIRKVTGRLSVF